MGKENRFCMRVMIPAIFLPVVKTFLVQYAVMLLFDNFRKFHLQYGYFVVKIFAHVYQLLDKLLLFLTLQKRE